METRVRECMHTACTSSPRPTAGTDTADCALLAALRWTVCLSCGPGSCTRTPPGDVRQVTTRWLPVPPLPLLTKHGRRGVWG